MRLLALSLVLLLAAAPARAADRVTVMLDWFVNPNHGPLIVAERLGLFEAQGLDVSLVAPADPALPPRLVAAGEADLAISYQPQLHLQVAQGLPLRRVGVLVATPLNCLMVRADGPIGTVADLKGATIGYSVAGVEEAVVTALLTPHGLSLDDVEMINVNWSLSPAVMSGQVDAVIGAFRNFELTQMRLLGIEGRCFYVEEEGSPVYDELIYVANAEALADPAHADKLRRFLAAVEAATHRIVNEPEAMFEVFSASGGDYGADLADALNTAAWTDTVPRFALSPAALDRARYRAYADFMAEGGLIPAGQTVSALAVDLSAAE